MNALELLLLVIGVVVFLFAATRQVGRVILSNRARQASLKGFEGILINYEGRVSREASPYSLRQRHVNRKHSEL